MTIIDPVLLQKYRETEYRVRSEPPFVLDLDQPSRELAGLYRARRASSAAFITAFNPYSQPADEALNEDANRRLHAELRSRSLEVIEAVGSDPGGHWKEPSFLVLGIPREQAEALGRAYRQNAIVFAGADAVPRLLLLR